MRTTLTIDDDVAARLEEETRRTGNSFKETVNSLLRLGLHASEQPKERKPFEVKARAMGLPLGLTYDKVEEIFDYLDGPDRWR